MLGHAAALHCRRLTAEAEVVPSLEAQRALEHSLRLRRASDERSAARPLHCRLSYRHRLPRVERDARKRPVGQPLPWRGHEPEHVRGLELGVEALLVGLQSELEDTLVVARVARVEAELRLLGFRGRGGAVGLGAGQARGQARGRGVAGGGVWLGAGWGAGYTALQAWAQGAIRRAVLRSRLELAEIVEGLLQ